MTAFILAALLLAVLAALFLAWPLLRGRSTAPAAPLAAALAVLALIMASAILYRVLGDRTWSRPGSAGEGNAMIVTLARHLEHQPQDQPGWPRSRPAPRSGTACSAARA